MSLQGCYDMQALMNDFHFKVFSSLCRIAVKMENPFLRTVNRDFFLTHGLDTAVLIQCPVEELERERRDIQYGERFQHCDIHHSVSQRSLRSNVGIISVLGSICAGYEKSFIAGGA